MLKQAMIRQFGLDPDGKFYDGPQIFNDQKQRVLGARAGTLSGTPESPGYISFDELAKIMNMYNIEMRDVKKYLKLQVRNTSNIDYNTQ